MTHHPVLSSVLLDERAVESSGITVQVCVLTYKRPEMLRSTLKSLTCQQTRSKRSIFRGNLQIRILVIDNDALKTGYLVTEELSAESNFPLRYVSEPARGLANARNRALHESQSVDFLAFIDDDETAQIDWLVHLVDGAVRFNAPVVTGPVRAWHLDSPRWIKQGNFFDSKRHLTGSKVPFVATNNVLLQASIVKSFRFDTRFDATGGEDTEFFMRLSRSGHQAVWVEEAMVTEYIPKDRATLNWLVNRARSDANRYTRSCLSFDRSPGTIARRLVIAAIGFLTGLARLPGVVFGRHHAARGLQLIYRSIGTVTALRGRAQIYYKASSD